MSGFHADVPLRRHVYPIVLPYLLVNKASTPCGREIRRERTGYRNDRGILRLWQQSFLYMK